MSTTHPAWRALRNALEEGDPDTGEELLKQHPELLDERNGIGETVLHFLAVEKNLPAVEWLHQQGASLDVKNAFGTPLLFEVATLGYRELFLWLIGKGADINLRQDDGQSLEDHLLEYNKNEEMLTFLREQGLFQG